MITTSADLTPCDDTEGKYILFIALNIEKIYRLSKLDFKDNEKGITQWIHNLVKYLVKLRHWTCSLTYYNANNSATFSSVIAVVEQNNFIRMILSEMEKIITIPLLKKRIKQTSK